MFLINWHIFSVESSSRNIKNLRPKPNKTGIHRNIILQLTHTPTNRITAKKIQHLKITPNL
jgi:hypothetical protein